MCVRLVVLFALPVMEYDLRHALLATTASCGEDGDEFFVISVMD